MSQRKCHANVWPGDSATSKVKGKVITGYPNGYMNVCCKVYVNPSDIYWSGGMTETCMANERLFAHDSKIKHILIHIKWRQNIRETSI